MSSVAGPKLLQKPWGVFFDYFLIQLRSRLEDDLAGSFGIHQCHAAVETYMSNGLSADGHDTVAIRFRLVAVFHANVFLAGKDLDLTLVSAGTLDRPLGEHELPEFATGCVDGNVGRHPLKGPGQNRLHSSVAPTSSSPDYGCVSIAPSQMVHDINWFSPM